jgi:hypothetical protein
MRASKIVAKSMGVSERSLYYTKRVHRSGRQNLIDAIVRGEMTTHAALRIIEPKQVDRYAALVKAWNAASGEDRRRLLTAVSLTVNYERDALPGTSQDVFLDGL